MKRKEEVASKRGNFCSQSAGLKARLGPIVLCDAVNSSVLLLLLPKKSKFENRALTQAEHKGVPRAKSPRFCRADSRGIRWSSCTSPRSRVPPAILILRPFCSQLLSSSTSSAGLVALIMTLSSQITTLYTLVLKHETQTSQPYPPRPKSRSLHPAADPSETRVAVGRPNILNFRASRPEAGSTSSGPSHMQAKAARRVDIQHFLRNSRRLHPVSSHLGT